jgi:aspartyl-tRNA(Asn)/glutamyl-tRNA(Gln) amidotransferase subunit A
MDQSNLPFMTVAELSRLIESREVSPVEVAQAYLDRIDDLDFKFNAFLTVSRREAMAAAREAEEAISRGDYLGPMHGIPVAVKDQFMTKGIRTTGGTRILADFVPEEDATIIANLKRAGAVLLGKTNMTEFAMGAGFERFSPPRNPWNLDRRTGGSSGGSGAATAAFLCATSLGEDTGGSIRFPATWCGLVGHRPTWGLVSRYGVMTGVWSMDTAGPISRTVEDAAITLNAIAGHDERDPYTWRQPVPDFRAGLNANINGLRVGVITEQFEDEGIAADTRDAVLKALGVLGELGATVEQVSIPLTAHGAILSQVPLVVEPALNMRHWVRERLQDYGHNNRIGLLTGSIFPAHAYHKAQKLRTMFRQQVHQALEQYDVLVTPTASVAALPIVEDPVISSKEQATPLAYLQTRTFNLASAPAASIPCGFSDEGLPIGLQIGGRPGADQTVLNVAYAYEQATQWHQRRPPNA